jgi:hypothetical protein
MENTADIDLKYPIGPFVKKEEYSPEEIESLISSIERAPELFRNTIENIEPKDLKKTYRLGSWSVQQLVHHVADIQLLHFLRMKKALTEPDYKEVTLIDMDAWARTADATNEPVEDSLMMLEGITRRYVFLIRSLTEEELQLTYYHPVRKYSINQAQAIAMSAWHLQHHLAHIKLAVE